MSKKSRAKETQKKKNPTLPPVTIEQIHAAEEWFSENEKAIPADVKACLRLLLDSALKGKENRAAALASFQQLLIVWGLQASSEKTQKKKLSAEEKEAKEASRYLNQLKYRFSKAHRVCREKRLAIEAQKFQNSAEETSAIHLPGASLKEQEILEKFEFGPEFQNKEERKKSDDILDQVDSEDSAAIMEADMNEVAALGQGSAQPIEASEEGLFPAIPLPPEKAEVSFVFSEAQLQENFPSSKNITRETYTSKNFDFILHVQELSVSTEIARDREQGISISAAPETFALKGFQITLRAMVNLILLSVVFLLPFHRISRLLGNLKIFHRSNISRYIGIVASRAVPVYLHLIEQLAQAEHIWGDASPTRVNEVERTLSGRKAWSESDVVGPPEPYPWEVSETSLQSDESSNVEDEPDLPLVSKTLFHELGYHFGSSKRKKATTKVRHQTMVIHGRTEKTNPLTHIVIFRSCLGDVGNVLDKMLLKRKCGKDQKPLTLQCDHSPANLPQDKEVLKRVKIIVAGCLAHLRRPFKRYHDHDPESCELIVGMMDHVFHNETLVKEAGRNELNTLIMRQRWSSRFLEYLHMTILEKSQLKTWSDQTPLGKAARSFTKNFKKLGPIMMDPFLELSNNICERLLRPEKLAQGSSYFRDTIEGRARFDVLRSLHQTCVSAKIPFGVYLLFILKTDPKLIQFKPSEYTPLAVKKYLSAKPTEEKNLLSALLTNF